MTDPITHLPIGSLMVSTISGTSESVDCRVRRPSRLCGDFVFLLTFAFSVDLLGSGLPPPRDRSILGLISRWGRSINGSAGDAGPGESAPEAPGNFLRDRDLSLSMISSNFFWNPSENPTHSLLVQSLIPNAFLDTLTFRKMGHFVSNHSRKNCDIMYLIYLPSTYRTCWVLLCKISASFGSLVLVIQIPKF